MDIRSRILNSTTPWSAVELKGALEGQTGLEGQRGSKEKSREEEEEEEEEPAARQIPALLRKVLTLGTAEAMASTARDTEKLCPFIAQAECDEQQEFSPSCSERPYIGSPNCLLSRASTLNSVAWRAACKKSPAAPQCPPSSRNRRKRPRQKRQRDRNGGEERERETEETALSGVPEQESNSAPWLFHTQDEAPELSSSFSSYCCTQSLGVQETERPRWERTESLQHLPHSQTPLPHSQTPLPHSQTPLPHSQAPLPHSQAPLPHSQAPLPHSQAPLPHSQAPLPHSQTPLPHSQTPLPHSQAPLPHSQTPLPHSQTPLPHSQTPLPHSQAPLPCSQTPLPWFSPGFDASIPERFLYSQESTSEQHLSSQDTWRLARFGLRGNVCQEDQVFVRPFFREVEKEEREEEKDRRSGDSDINEGLLFHPEEKLQPNDYEYREGRDYAILRHIRSGSYGDVYSVQDNKTGFKCAAKKILLKLFRSEEVSSWSSLDSPRVVELYGAVREGPCVTLFMALKSGWVGELIRERGRLPEDLALHYHSHVLEALQQLHRWGVVHLDVKADNVLLSADGREACLSDFGHSEKLDRNGWSTTYHSGEGFPGTETHMAPEVVRGEPRSAKADTWSSCCMLLHMLTGCHPWTRYYPSPLCLKIATEDPPLREIPSNCNPCTADVIKAGLQKHPIKRASATELRERNTRALLAVGGLTSPVKGAYQQPAKAEPMETRHKRSGPLPSLLAPPSTTASRRRSLEPRRQCKSSWREHSHSKDAAEENSEADWLSSSYRPRPQLHPHSSRQPKGEEPHAMLLAWELEKEFYRSSLSQLHSLELQEQLLSCLSSGGHPPRDPHDTGSERWSVGHSGDLSSGVFSGSSQPDGQSFGVDWPGSAHVPPPCLFQGVDVHIQDFSGQCLRIRECPGVTVGHIATGISDQISESPFCLETRDGRPLCPEAEVQDSGLWLRCAPTPDSGRPWRWRVQEGVLEVRE